MKIAIDAMGGDHGPIVTMAGLANSISEHPDLEAKVFGSEEQVVPFGQLKQDDAVPCNEDGMDTANPPTVHPDG